MRRRERRKREKKGKKGERGGERVGQSGRGEFLLSFKLQVSSK